MRIHEIEDWALRVIKRVQSGGSVEDARVELKRDFIEPEKAARRIAGHANSAGGEPILWIIGVDEKTGRLFNVKEDTADWWSRVQSRFEGIPPAMTDLALSTKGENLKALLFDTDRRPFVVKTSPGTPGLEVPWRDGTRTRSATRNELVQLLTPVARLPDFEVLTGSLGIQEIQSGAAPVFEWKLNLHLYVVPKDDVRLVFPFHRTSCTIKLEGTLVSIAHVVLEEVVSHQAGGVRIGDPQATIRGSASELVVTGAGSFYYRAGYATGSHKLVAAAHSTDRPIVTVTILPVHSDVSAVLKIELHQINATGRNLVEFRYP